MERKGAGTPNNLKSTSYSVQLLHAEPERVMVSGIAKCVCLPLSAASVSLIVLAFLFHETVLELRLVYYSQCCCLAFFPPWQKSTLLAGEVRMAGGLK